MGTSVSEQGQLAGQPASDAANVAGGRADVAMRRVLRVSVVDRGTELAAHRSFRRSLVLSGVRCVVSYVLIPLLVPVISFFGVVATPISLLLCVFAAVNGVASVRRFWRADHRLKWMYTMFIGIVFVVLTVAVTGDIAKLAATV
ncbi:hypothetical protein [Leucobacter triazinivorans]|nr:hypothetical protein [Leucobacter triazinivorans]